GEDRADGGVCQPGGIRRREYLGAQPAEPGKRQPAEGVGAFSRGATPHESLPHQGHGRAHRRTPQVLASSSSADTVDTMKSLMWRRLVLAFEMIRFEHSVFALPFALTGALLAFREGGYDFSGLKWKVVWIVVAMVGARSAAMAFNRLVDAPFDARNPRTKMRHLPAGLLSSGFGWGFVAAASLLFFAAAAALNPLCLMLAPVALGIVFFYSFTKRFTSFSHLVLGFSLGIAPAAAWIAVRGSLDPRILWLTAAVTFWTAGFDVIYSCQDFDFDRAEGLFSVPRVLGIAGALRVAQLLHVLIVGCL